MDFLMKWLKLIRNGNIDNTYKMAWAKAITEISLELDFHEEDDTIKITLEQIAEKILKYYWDQTIYFNLIQGSNPNKPPKIISLSKALIERYQVSINSKQPTKYLISNVNKILTMEYKRTIKKVVTALKSDVSYRFLNLNGKKVDNIYKYNKGDNELYILKSNLLALKDNYQIVFDIINLRWTEILEGFNHSPRISKKVRVIDIENISRKSLNKFYNYIEMENPNKVCFLCGKEIIGEKPSIDHIIPWSYLYENDIWNLVFVHKSCNSSKSNIIPNEKIINRLEERNQRLLSILKNRDINNKITSELEYAIENNLVRKFWISCQG